ncbi:MAG: efflux RND transporter permease subunit [Saezia sp.]
MEKRNNSIYLWCITHPIGTVLLTCALVFLGALAYSRLPVASLPDTDYPTIRISANLAGASPETMASAVATPLEVQLSSVPGITEMISTSSSGSVSITLQFTLEKDINVAVQEVQAALNAVAGKLPDEMSDAPRWRKFNPADMPILVLSASSDSMSLTELSDQVETVLARQISQIDGVGDVAVWGLRRPAIRIQAKPENLVAAGVTMEDIRNAVRKTSVNQPKGTLYGAQQTSFIEINDQIFEPEQFENLIIQWRNGTPVYLRDIASVRIGPENEYTMSWPNGKPGVGLVIFREPGTNITATVDRVQQALPELRAMLPAALEVNVLNDRTRTIRASLHEVQFTLILSILLVIGVMALFLRQFAATVIVAVVLSVSLISTCGIMYLLGFSLNNLTLVAIIVSVGFIVDDAIIVIENIHRHLEAGLSPFKAAYQGIQEIGFTVFSISVSLIAAFIPLLFMGGIVGRLFREFSITATAAITISMLLCLTLAPTLAALYMKATHKPGTTHKVTEDPCSPAPKIRKDFFTFIITGYQHGLDWVLRHQRITLLGFLVTLCISITGFIVIPKGFFPLQDTGFMFGSTQAASDISFEDMAAKHKQIEAILLADPDIQGFNNSIGNSTSMGAGRMMIDLKDLDQRKSSIYEVIGRLRTQFNKIPGINVYLRASQDIIVGAGSSRTQYFYSLRTQDIDELALWTNDLTTRLKQNPMFLDVSNDLEWDAHIVNLSVNRELAAQYGFAPESINSALYDAFGQRQVNEVQTQTNQYKIILGFEEVRRGNIESLDYFYLRSPLTNELVPLKTFVTTLPPKLGAVTIKHLAMQPSANISFNLANGVALGDATKQLEQIVEELQMPAHIFGSFQGTAQVFKDSLRTQPLLILAAILAVYIVLGVLYESFIHPLTIISTLPSAGIGAVIFLMIGGFDFSVMALIGIVLLIGIVKKNGILLIDFALHAMREQNLPAQEAIRQACLIRFRPIIMTTLAAMLAAVPLMFSLGTGSELRQPLGVAIVGGLLVSQLLTLFSTPVIFLMFHSLFQSKKEVQNS